MRVMFAHGGFGWLSCAVSGVCRLQEERSVEEEEKETKFRVQQITCVYILPREMTERRNRYLLQAPACTQGWRFLHFLDTS